MEERREEVGRQREEETNERDRGRRKRTERQREEETNESDRGRRKRTRAAEGGGNEREGQGKRGVCIGKVAATSALLPSPWACPYT
jgi:hypothetical protein